MGILTGCKPRKDVLKGDLDDAIFAADFGNLIEGKAPAVYGSPKTFFQNTHPAKQLCKIIEAVFCRLANPKEKGATIRLSTGFGGGKTHTLMALWHLGQSIEDPSLGTELLPAAGRPTKMKVVAVDAGKAGLPIFSTHGAVKVKSLWGEIFYKLGGEKALKALGEADDPEKSPNDKQIEAAFPAGPVLILLDELVVYMAKLSDRGQGNMLGFMKSLASVVTERKQTVLVVTDPADQRAYAKEATKIGDNLAAAAAKLDDIFDREMADFDPIGEESARVIVRRLFESVNTSAAQAASAMYHSLYERVATDYPGCIPPEAASADYAKRIVECYPFHPRMLDTAQGRLGALQEFHKSRGTLRLFARILRTIWDAKQDLDLITAGDVDWTSDRIQADLLQRLNRDNFKSAVLSDIERHAAVDLDGGKARGIHLRVASALLLESIPMQANSGLSNADLSLAVLRPDEAGMEPSEALDRLVGVCWHTYPMPGGRGWQFRYEPNIIKQIEENMTHVSIEDAKSRVLSETQGYFSGPAFKLTSWPTSARQVPESKDLQLVLCEEEKVAGAVCAYVDDSDPQAPIPRRFINAIIAVTSTASAMNSAVDCAQRLMSAEAIEREHRAGESAKLVREQLKRIMPELQKKFRIQTCRAFDRVHLAGGVSYRLDERYQVPEEQILQKAHGQTSIRKFLEEKNLIYQQGDHLDVGRFMKDILPGATPLAESPDAYTARAVHERFLGAPGLRLIPDGGIVRQTLLKALSEGKAVIRLGEGRAYDAKGVVEGPEGKRKRTTGTITTLSLDDTAWVTRVDSQSGIRWTKEDPKIEDSGPEGPTPPPPQPPKQKQLTATSWESIIQYAENRPLLKLDLLATKPAPAAQLPPLLQPLGAEALSVTINVSGTMKEGGNLNFAVNGVKINHPVRPLTVAQTFFNSLGSDADYELDLTLDFGAAGRTDLQSSLKSLSENVPEDVSPQALFDKPRGDE